MLQEFSFANGFTKSKINSIYNTHFTGSVLWDLFGDDACKIYSTWNTSVRKMFRLDRTTHRYFIEAVSNMSHIKKALMKRFMKFTNKISESPKVSARNILNTIKEDCRSTTGRNLRMIMKCCKKQRLGDVTNNAISQQHYVPVPVSEKWRIDLVKELLDIRDNIYDSVQWNTEEISCCINYLCTT